MYVFDKPKPWKLPVVKENKQNRQMLLRVTQLKALLKRIDINDTRAFDIEIGLFLNEVHTDGYNEGIAHMNKIIDRLCQTK